MVRELSICLNPKEAASEMGLRMAVSSALGIDINRIKKIDILKKSIDARQKNIKINLTVNAHIDSIDTNVKVNPFCGIKYPELPAGAPSAIVVGAGPAGLFAALQLIESGIRPIVLERGKDVDQRRKDLAEISRSGYVNPESNYCFGEGGAGTFSDGKLYTRSKKKGSVDKILAVLYDHGANDKILYEAHPHIGTDVLPIVIKNIRQTILNSGGEVFFNTKVERLLLEDETNGRYKCIGVVTSSGKEFFGPVILATGHSARDTFRNLVLQGVKFEPKGLAVGVRLEHPQQLIDRLQYHAKEGRGAFLPAAEYSFLTRVDGRGVYSFCMCPGGVIVPSASGPGQSVVNGMSSSARSSKWANSGMVVEILPDDVQGESPLKMLDFQESIEKKFFEDAGGTQKAPAQRMTDFVEGKDSSSLEPSSYAPGIYPSRVDRLLPSIVSDRLRKGFLDFNRKKRGFLTSKATVVGAETRTSSPVRIPRDEIGRNHVDIEGLYPVGEGAGWAGGIVSSAIDGQNSAVAVAEALKNKKA